MQRQCVAICHASKLLLITRDPRITVSRFDLSSKSGQHSLSIFFYRITITIRMTLTGGTCPAGSLDSRLRQVPVVRSVLGPSRISGAGRSFQRRRTHRIIIDRPATGSRRQSAGHMHRDCDFRTCRSGVLLTLELPDRVGGFVGCDSNSGVHWQPVVIP